MEVRYPNNTVIIITKVPTINITDGRAYIKDKIKLEIRIYKYKVGMMTTLFKTSKLRYIQYINKRFYEIKYIFSLI